MTPKVHRAVIIGVCIAFSSLAAQAQQQATLSAARQAAIESHMAQWSDSAAKAKRLAYTFLSAASADPRYKYGALKMRVDDALRMSAMQQTQQLAWQQNLLAQLGADSAAGKISAQDRTTRGNAVIKIFQLRMLYTYGAIFPQVLDEAAYEGNHPAGRFLAGSDWKMELTAPEMQALYAQYKARSGFTPDLVDQN
jgi:hypothetical protein